MEERQTYTYKKKEASRVNPVKLALAVIAIAVIAVAAVAGVKTGVKKADTESSVAASKEALSKAAEASTVPAAKYSPGNYIIQTGGYTLLLREQPSKNAADHGEIPDKTVIRITEISESDNTADKNYQYWGKTQYEGEVGWVPMGYLQITDAQPEEEEVATTEETADEADADEAYEEDGED